MPPKQSVQSLQDTFGHPGKVTFSAGPAGLTKVLLKAADGEAELYLQGAHITDFTPGGHKPVLFMSKASEFATGKPIRGGVPICWPWFGARADGEGPGHGFARLSDWTVTDTNLLDDGRVSITLQLTPNAMSKQLWDQPFKVAFTVMVGQSLEMSLTTSHEGEAGSPAFSFTEALHSYFSVGDVRKVSITGLEQQAYIDKMSGGATIDQGDKPITFEGETDRVYQGPATDTEAGSTTTCISHDPVMGRRIIIEKSGSKSTVVWNPWIDKAARMEDFGDDEWPTMHCIETANALDHAITLKPGESHAISAKISVSPL